MPTGINTDKFESQPKLASINQAYGTLVIGVLGCIFAIRELRNSKDVYGYMLVLLLLLLGYFFLTKAFKISSLSYKGNLIFISKIGKSLTIPFNHVLEIKREKATVDRSGPLSFGYRVYYTDEDQRSTYSIVFVRSDRIPNLEILAERIKDLNPAVILNL
jgi:hypothetical protein